MNIIRLLLIIAINIALVFAGDVYKCVKDNTRIYGNNKGQNYVGAWLDNGDYIYATGVSNGYAKFYKGYVSLSGLQKQTSTKTNYKVIAKDGLYFNSGPGTTYNSLILKTYDTGVVYYGRDWWENNWGVTNYGYCTMDYLVICPNSNCKGSSGGGSAGVYKCVKDNTRIYGNNKGQNYVGAWLDNGDYIYATGVSNGYAKFYKGYVSLSGLQKQTSTKTNYKVTAKDGLYFNSGPGTNYNSLSLKKYGTAVVYYGRDWWENNWGVTNYGYCSMNYLTCTNCGSSGGGSGKFTTKNVIDISEFNIVTNYNTAASSSDVDGVIMRVGGTGWGSGGIYADTAFEKHYTGFKNTGKVKIGYYFFSQAITEQEAINEAQYVINKIKGKRCDFPIYWDSEIGDVDNQNGRADHLSKAQRTKVGLAFVNHIKSKGYKAGVYASESWYIENIDYQKFVNAGASIWVAKWSSYEPTSVKYDIWQYSSTGSISGINGVVDKSRVTKNIAGW